MVCRNGGFCGFLGVVVLGCCGFGVLWFWYVLWRLDVFVESRRFVGFGIDEFCWRGSWNSGWLTRVGA